MKKLLILFASICLTGCATTVQIACTEPSVEVFINEVNYGQPPVLLKVPHDVMYVDASFRKNGMEVHKQRIYFVDGQNYYEVTIPKHLQKTTNQPKYHSTH